MRGETDVRFRTSWLLLSLLMLVACTPPPLQEGWQGGSRRWFEAELLTGYDDDGSRVATLAVSVPYRNLVFKKFADGYRAAYRIRAVQRSGRDPLRSAEWTGEVHAADYEETRSATMKRHTVQVPLEDSRAEDAVSLQVTLLVEGTQRRSSTLLSVAPGRVAEGGVELAELALYRRRHPFGAPLPATLEIGARSVPDAESFVRMVRSEFDYATGAPWVLIRVFDLAGVDGATEYAIRIRARSESDESWTTTVDVPKQGVETSLLMRLPSEAFSFGSNELSVHLAGAGDRVLGVYDLGLDLEEEASWRANLRQVDSFASDDEMDRLKDAPGGARQQRWDEFWLRRDPDPSNAENERLDLHLQRLDYARRNLQDGFRSGVLSDRGRVFVAYGDPPNIEDVAATFSNPVRWQIWEYPEQGIAYYFRLTQGGNYRLAWSEPI